MIEAEKIVMRMVHNYNWKQIQRHVPALKKNGNSVSTVEWTILKRSNFAEL